MIRHHRVPRPRHGLLGLLFVFFFLCAPAVASAGDPWAPFDAPWFDQVDVSDGLPYSITTAVAQDRDGLIWIGTMGGLVRYDGHRAQVFGARSDGPSGLPDAYVRNLLALPDGSLLIGTNIGGLTRFDPTSNTFKSYAAGPNGLVELKIYDLANDPSGGAWIATEAGLSHLDLRTHAITHVDTGADTAPRNFSVLQDRAGNLWLGNENGLFVRRKGSKDFVRATATDDITGKVLSNQIWALAQDHEGRIWAGSVQAGAAYRDANHHWHGVPGFSGYQDGARLPTVRDMLEVRDGTMWLATDGGGLIQYSPATGQLRPIRHDPARPSSLPGDSVRGLLRDRSGNLWAATDLGLARNNPNARTAFSLLPSPLDPHALADPVVHAIFVDSRERIWLGLGSGHIDLIDLAAGSMQHLHLGGIQTQREVRSLTEAADGSIWVGTQGLARIDPDTLVIQDAMLPALRDKPVLALQPDGSRLLIGTYDGLYRYDIHTQQLDHITQVAGDPHSLISNSIGQIARIGNHWWFGTPRGISIAEGNVTDGRFTNLRHDPHDPTSLPQDYVSSINGDAHGHAWVSTFGGLAVLEGQPNAATHHFMSIGKAQGLSSDKVIAVLSAGHDQLWASVANGVARINPATHAVTNLGRRDGLRITSYVNVAAARAPGGELLFGGLGGLTVVRPHWQPQSVPAAPLAITNATVNGRSLPFGQLPRGGDTVDLPNGNRNLRLDFALLDYQAAAETAYSYRIDGLDAGWTRIPAGSMPSAIYTNLPHGSYRLRLRAVTRGMQPHTIETDLNIVVEPRWYETTLSRLLAVLLIIALVIALVHLRTHYLRRYAARQKRQIEAHTRDLIAANRRLDELASKDDLTGVYNRRRFLELTRRERDRAQRGAICIALFDLDRFKLINDTHGHLAGDEVIRNAIEVIKQQCRQGDFAGRYGGEEFVLCLPDTPLSAAEDVAERIRHTLANTTSTHDGRSISVTVSVGVAALRAGESIEQWLSRADEALYEAKRAGRNRCATAS